MNLLRRVHNSQVHTRRVRVLARHLCDLIPANVSLLDVGSGDGLLASRVLAHRADLKWVAIDPLARPKTHVPVHPFAGDRLPFADKDFDFVLFVDVLHHSDAPMVLLREAIRFAQARHCGLWTGSVTRPGEYVFPTTIGTALSGRARWTNLVCKPKRSGLRLDCTHGGRIGCSVGRFILSRGFGSREMERRAKR